MDAESFDYALDETARSTGGTAWLRALPDYAWERVDRQEEARVASFEHRVWLARHLDNDR